MQGPCFFILIFGIIRKLTMSKLPDIEELLNAGVHYGHQVKRWNPKMAQYIFTQKSGIHVIDLEKTEEQLQKAVDFIKNLASSGGTVLFLATKKQAAEIVKEEAKRVGAKYLTMRWIGGLLTNYESVRKTIDKLDQIEEKLKEKESYTKKEQLLLQKELAKLERMLGGVRDLDRLPDALFIVDARKEDNAVREANKMEVPIVALVDTNGDPTKVDYPIVANDDSIKSIALLVKVIADAYAEGRKLWEKKVDKQLKEQEKTAADEEKGKVSEFVNKLPTKITAD